MALNVQVGKVVLHITRLRSAFYATSSWRGRVHFVEEKVSGKVSWRQRILKGYFYTNLGGTLGKETQIISAEVYERVGESKFIPIFCELFEDGSPCLPTYLKSRFAIDFSRAKLKSMKTGTINPRPIRPTVIPKTCARRPIGVCHRAPGSSRPSASKFLSWRQIGARHVIR